MQQLVPCVADGLVCSNPSNSMWKLLTGNLPPLVWDGILPMYARIHEQNTMPVVIGVGFTSIGLEVGMAMLVFKAELLILT